MDGEPERCPPLDKQIHRTIDWTKNPHFKIVFDETVEFFESLKNQQRHSYYDNALYPGYSNKAQPLNHL